MNDSKKDTPTSVVGIKPITLIGVALFLVLIWGSAFTLIDVAVQTLSPEWLVAYRMMIGASLVLIYSRLIGHRLPGLRDKRWLWYAVIAFTGASLPFVLIATGQKSVDSGLSAILVGTMPLITIILAHFFTDEKLTGMKFIGFLIGFIGIVVLFLPEDLSLSLVSDWQAQGIILIGSACYAVTTIIASRAPDTPSPVGAAMMLLIGAFLSTTWAALTAGPPPMPSKAALYSVIALGLGSTGIATVTYLWVIDKAGPSVMARINYFIPVCSVILGVIYLKEALDWRIFVALFVILLGVIISRLGKASKT